ncbi:scavenger receptor cysteine-rich type 1 protein M130-like [Callospermophilus lateralis]|uniref:scavenger receptor cysteine-rich type 1 protein M130-like n=1 Tax=Callospermophilus lateralis TaxID=76772 RepID=UPI004053B8F9
MGAIVNTFIKSVPQKGSSVIWQAAVVTWTTGSKGSGTSLRSANATGHSSLIALLILGVILLASLITFLVFTLRRRRIRLLTVSTRGENFVHQVQYREMNSSLEADDLDQLHPSGFSSAFKIP